MPCSAACQTGLAVPFASPSPMASRVMAMTVAGVSPLQSLDCEGHSRTTAKSSCETLALFEQYDLPRNVAVLGVSPPNRWVMGAFTGDSHGASVTWETTARSG